MTKLFQKNVLKLVVRTAITVSGTYFSITTFPEPIIVGLISTGFFTVGFLLSEKLAGEVLSPKNLPMVKQTIFAFVVSLGATFLPEAIFVVLLSGVLSLALGKIDK